MALVVADSRQKQSPPAGRQSGFTLIELMVAIAVLAIVTTVAVPSFNSLVQGNRLTSSANQLLSGYHSARSEAIKRSQAVVLCATTDGTTCSNQADWAQWLVMANNEIVMQGRVANGLKITGPADTNIVFSAGGMVRNNSGAGLAANLRVCTTSSAITENTRILSFVAGGGISVTRGASNCA